MRRDSTGTDARGSTPRASTRRASTRRASTPRASPTRDITARGITARGLTVRYADTLALDAVDVSVPEGTVCGLLGMNGSGKSTLFKALMGLVRPEHGTIELLGRRPWQARADGLIAYVPQAEAVDWNFPVTVADVVMMGRYGRLGPTRRPRAADRTAVDEALERVGLASLARDPIGTLSGGQRKRAFVGRAIAQGAPLLLFDEPFAGVDRPSESTIVELLRGLRADGVTIMISTHDLASVPALCDEAILLQQRVVAHGELDDVITPESLARAFGARPRQAS